MVFPKTSQKPPYPYVPEKFTLKEKKVLLNFFTNVDKPVFAIHNLPQEVIGAMFSRYSRSGKSVRRLFLDEFSLSGQAIKSWGNKGKYLKKATERTREFFKKVFAEYGDDSVIQMGSVHIAFEFISQIVGAKAVEDQRVASSYIEKSTRYVDFSSKINNRFLSMEPVEIMSSKYKKLFQKWSGDAFNLYAKNIPTMISFITEKYPIEKQKFEDEKTGKKVPYANFSEEEKTLLASAYKRAVRAKALDTIRFFLPLTAVTNLGAHFSGQAAELTINKMLISPFSEVRYYGAMAYEELMKVSPNFLQNIDHKFGEIARNYRAELGQKKLLFSKKQFGKPKKIDQEVARLINFDKDADVKIASDLLFTSNKSTVSKLQIVDWAKSIKKKDKGNFSSKLISTINDAVPVRNKLGRSRRQKLPRSFEQAYAEVEFLTDIGAYKDLQRNRLSSTQRGALNADLLYIPEEYYDPKLKEVLKDYLQLADKTKSLNAKIRKTKNISHAADYIALMGNKVRYTVKANLRQWCFFAELRTIAGGHPTYRKALQEATREIIKAIPFMQRFFANVDWTPDYGLGRLKAEINTQKGLAKIKKNEK